MCKPYWVLWLQCISSLVRSRFCLKMFFGFVVLFVSSLCFTVCSARKPVQREGIALHLVRGWLKARSRTTWNPKANLYHGRALGICRRTVRRRRLRTVRPRNSRPVDNVFVTAVKSRQAGDSRLLLNNDGAVYLVAVGLPAHQPRSPPQLTGNNLH